MVNIKVPSDIITVPQNHHHTFYLGTTNENAFVTKLYYQHNNLSEHLNLNFEILISIYIVHHYVFARSLLFSSRLHLFDQKYNKNSNITI